MVTVSKIKETDLEMIMNWRMKPEITQYMYTDPLLSIDDQKNWFKKINQNISSIYRLINYNGIPIGLYSINFIDTNNKTCFWGYYIGESEYYGKGIGKTIECNHYDYCFDILKMNKVCCEVLSFNEKVVKIHEHFGASIEGLFKQQIKKGNSYFDVIRMGILKDDWFSKRQDLKYINLEIS